MKSPNYIQEKLRGWLSSPSFVRIYKNKTAPKFSNPKDQAQNLIELAKKYDFREDCTLVELQNHLKDLFTDPDQWHCCDKSFVEEDFNKYFVEGDSGLEFALDCGGDSNHELVEKCANQDYVENCIVRGFSPNKAFSNNICLIVISNPEDTEIVGWTISRD